MRTWKQGVIGRLELGNGTIVYTKCLKYPLLKIAESYDIAKFKIGEELISVFVDLSVLKKIEKITSEILTKEEKEIGLAFDMEYVPGTSIIDKMTKTEYYNDIKTISEKGIVDLERLNMILIRGNDIKDKRRK